MWGYAYVDPLVLGFVALLVTAFAVVYLWLRITAPERLDELLRRRKDGPPGGGGEGGDGWK